MTVDNSKLNYLSSWDIDQLVATGEVNIPSVGTHAIYTIPSTLPGIPTFEVQFKPTGTAKWFQTGSYTLNNTLASYDVIDAYVSAGVIYAISQAGTIRYFVWTDKVNY